MQQDQPDFSSIRLAELMTALSLATDLGMGQPMEFALCSCVLAIRLGDLLGLDDNDLRDAYYYALLRYIGCNAETYAMTALFGDELAMRKDYASIDPGSASELFSFVLRNLRQANAGVPPLQFVRTMAQGLLTASQVSTEGFAGHCEVAQRLAGRLGFGESLIRALGQLYERWDGRGLPNHLKGEAIAPSVRVVILAQDTLIFYRLGGVEAAVAMAQERSGTAYDPHIVEQFCAHADQLLSGLDEVPTWDTVLSIEPGQRLYLTDAQFNTACQTIADFADIKSPYTLGHSHKVADLAAEAARRCGLPESDAITLRRAGLLHEIGRVGVSTGIWMKTGPLSDREREQVRLHPYYTERVLARPQILARLGALASLHHERLDGSGYHHGATSSALPPAARILGAANAYQAMLEDRPHRPARSPEAAADELRREVRAGRLDSEAVNAVLAAAGHHVSATRRAMVAGLSERELEVLRLLARGNSIKQISKCLTISDKTVDNHIQHIYIKIGVSTRAGATLFAMEQDLLTD